MATPWDRSVPQKSAYPALQEDITTDVVIVGGGMAGILNAYLLSKAGKKVVVLESGRLGNGATFRTTAFITKVIDSSLGQIASIFGDAIAKTVWDSGEQAINEIEKAVKAERIDCEFTRCSNYVFAHTKQQRKEIEKEFKMYRKMRMAASLHDEASTLHFPNFGYLEIPDQAKFNPALFLSAIAEAATKNGARIFEKTAARKISGDDPVMVQTPHGTITAKDLLICTYKPLTDKNTQLKKGMYRSYILELEIPKDVLREGIYEDESNPYHYFRVDPQEKKDRVILGGEDHKDIFGNTLDKKSFKALEAYAHGIFGGIRYKIVNRWSGPILEPSDGLPLIGSIKPHYYVASAFSGNGMTYSMISALLIRDLILKKKNVWENAYDPKRFLWVPKRLASKAKDYIEEFIGGAAKNMLR